MGTAERTIWTLEEFDAWQGYHEFSEEYRTKKQSILRAFEECGSAKGRRSMVRAAALLLAVLLVTGTAMAFDSDLLQVIYKKRGSGIAEEYLYKDLLHTKYELPVEIETDYSGNLLDFQVLQAEKGEHSVSFAVLITVNDPEGSEDVEMYHIVPDYWPKNADGSLIDWTAGNAWTASKEELQMFSDTPEKQILQFLEYRFDDSVDLGSLESIDISFMCLDAILEKEVRHINDSNIWTLHIPVPSNADYEDYDYTVDAQYELFGQSVHIDSIHLSPFTAAFLHSATAGTTEAEMGGPAAFLQDHWQEVYLVMADGKKLSMETIKEEGTFSAYGDEGKTQVEESFTLLAPIDVRQVIGIEIDGQRITLKK